MLSRACGIIEKSAFPKTLLVRTLHLQTTSGYLNGVPHPRLTDLKKARDPTTFERHWRGGRPPPMSCALRLSGSERVWCKGRRSISAVGLDCHSSLVFARHWSIGPEGVLELSSVPLLKNTTPPLANSASSFWPHMSYSLNSWYLP